MSMSTSSQPWVGSPIANLSLSDPRCNNDSCQAFYIAHQLSQKEVSYYYQYQYGHFVTWYYLAFLGIFTIVFALREWQNRRSSVREPISEKTGLGSRGIAAWRYIAYRRVPGWTSNRFGLPSMGMLAFLLLFVLYICVLTFAIRPYYRMHRGFGSPPLAVRTGLMAVALTPLIIALAGKANIVTLLTGISHEKLNIIHRWVGWICFGLSVVHTIPFIVAPLQDGGYAALHKQFYKPGGYEYTGVPPLAMLFGLLIFSIPWIRHRVYETFYHLHFWLAVAYVGLMFWHAGMEGDSWVYLWATITAWLLSIVARAFWFTRPMNVMQSRWMVGAPAQMKSLPGDMIHLELLAPERFRWQPGQHVFLRFPTISLLDNHPFTIASADLSKLTTTSKEDPEYQSTKSMSFFIRVHDGFTKRLNDYMTTHVDAQLDAWIDGPYGGHHFKPDRQFDTVLLIAGGSGISACLPWFELLAQQMLQPSSPSPSFVKLLWSIRDEAHLSWISEALQRLNLSKLKDRIDITIHISGSCDVTPSPSSSSSPTRNPSQTISSGDIEKLEPYIRETSATDISDATTKGINYSIPAITLIPNTIHRSRADIFSVVNSTISSPLPSQHKPNRLLVLTCGPMNLKVDVSNACARAQSKVLRGEMNEVALVSETFGW